ncbi:MAG: Phosphonate metabolism protein PhnG [Solirubrobacteraceae bacterium]
MTPERRAAGLAAAARVCREQLLAIGERVAGGRGVEIIQPPTPGSVMLELDSSVGPFCLGEAVITTCSVSVDGRTGWASVLGLDRPGALAAALAEADGRPEADALSDAALALEQAARDAQARAVAETKVTLA